MPIRISLSFIALLGYFAQAHAGRTCGLTLPKDVPQGALVKLVIPQNMTLSVATRKLKATATGAVVFGVSHQQTSPMLLTLTGADQKPCMAELPIVQRQWATEVVNGVPQSTVTPDKAQQDRIAAEGQLITAARATLSARSDWQAAMQWPASGRISGVYGSRRIVNKLPLNPHLGLDIAAPKGAAVTAPWAGQVSLVYSDMLMTGGTLLIDHGHGISTIYIHLSKILVHDGDIIKPGQKIAEIGSTGRASGPHLHFQVHWFQEKLDPRLLLPTVIPRVK